MKFPPKFQAYHVLVPPCLLGIGFDTVVYTCVVCVAAVICNFQWTAQQLKSVFALSATRSLGPQTIRLIAPHFAMTAHFGSSVISAVSPIIPKTLTDLAVT
jgi:hypothetical protein